MPIRIALGLVCSLALTLQASEHFPSKPVRIVEPFGAGGGVDVRARTLSKKLSELGAQPVTVENHTGEEAPQPPRWSRSRCPTATRYSQTAVLRHTLPLS